MSNETAEQIDESLIPYNMTWRAGIGHDVKNPQMLEPRTLGGFDPFQYKPGAPNISPNPYAKPSPTEKNRIEWLSSFIPEIDANVELIASANKGDIVKTKQEIKNYFKSMLGKYGEYMTGKTYGQIYTHCLQKYTSDWVMICSNNGVTNPSCTEYVSNPKRNEYHVNPFTVYSMLAAADQAAVMQVPIYEQHPYEVTVPPIQNIFE